MVPSEPHRLLAAASLQALTGTPVAREQASLSWGRGTLLALRFPRVAPGSSWETGPPTKSAVFRPPHPAAPTSIPWGLVKLLVSPDRQAGLTSQPELRPWGPSEESQLRKPRFRTRSPSCSPSPPSSRGRHGRLQTVPWAQCQGQKALPPRRGSFQGAAHHPVQSQGSLGSRTGP